MDKVTIKIIAAFFAFIIIVGAGFLYISFGPSEARFFEAERHVLEAIHLSLADTTQEQRDMLEDKGSYATSWLEFNDGSICPLGFEGSSCRYDKYILYLEGEVVRAERVKNPDALYSVSVYNTDSAKVDCNAISGKYAQNSCTIIMDIFFK